MSAAGLTLTSPQALSGTVASFTDADAGGSTAVATSSVLIYAFATPGGGSFVIGDGNAATGTQVDFWGSHWAKDNTLSSGKAHGDFNGFAEAPSSNPPACGGTWSTGPGKDSKPPAALPAYLGGHGESSAEVKPFAGL